MEPPTKEPQSPRKLFDQVVRPKGRNGKTCENLGLRPRLRCICTLSYVHILISPTYTWSHTTTWWPASPGALFVSQNSECFPFWLPLFGRKGAPLGGVGGSNFRRGTVARPYFSIRFCASLFFGVKKHQSASIRKNHLNHAVDRPKMHVVQYILFQEFASHLRKGANRKNAYFSKIWAPSFLHFLPSAARSLKRTKKTQEDRNWVFWDPLAHFEVEGGGRNFRFGMCVTKQQVFFPRVVCLCGCRVGVCGECHRVGHVVVN